MVNVSQGNSTEYLHPTEGMHNAIIAGVQHIGFGTTYKGPNGEYKKPNDTTSIIMLVYQLDEKQPANYANGEENPDAGKPYFMVQTLGATANLTPKKTAGTFLQILSACFGKPALLNGEANPALARGFDERNLLGKQVQLTVQIDHNDKAKIVGVFAQRNPIQFGYYEFPESTKKFIEWQQQNNCRTRDIYNEETGEMVSGGELYTLSPAHFGAKTHGQQMQQPPRQNPTQQNNNGGYQQQQPNEYPDNNFGNSPIDAPNDDYAPF